MKMKGLVARVLIVLLLVMVASFYLLPSLLYFVFKLTQFIIVAGVVFLIYQLVKRDKY